MESNSTFLLDFKDGIYKERALSLRLGWRVTIPCRRCCPLMILMKQTLWVQPTEKRKGPSIAPVFWWVVYCLPYKAPNSPSLILTVRLMAHQGDIDIALVVKERAKDVLVGGADGLVLPGDQKIAKLSGGDGGVIGGWAAKLIGDAHINPGAGVLAGFDGLSMTPASSRQTTRYS